MPCGKCATEDRVGDHSAAQEPINNRPIAMRTHASSTAERVANCPPTVEPDIRVGDIPTV
jgi:hypothetical protein